MSTYYTKAQKAHLDATAIYADKSSTAEDFERAEKLMEDARLNFSLYEKEKGILDFGQELQSDAPTPRQPKKEKFDSFGEYLTSVDKAGRGKGIDERLNYMDATKEMNGPSVSKDLVSNVGSSGGYLVPEEFQASLKGLMAEDSFIRSRATVFPMSSRQILIPKVNQNGTTANEFHQFGGMVGYWQDEGDALTESDTSFSQVELTSWEFTAYTRVTDILMQDSAISLDAFFRSPLGFSGLATKYLDRAFLRGNGIKKPLGVLNSDAVIAESRASGGSITYDDLIQMFGKFLPSANGVWVASQTTMAELMSIEGPSGNPSYLWGDMVNGRPNTLLGLPIIFTELAVPLGSRGDISLIDWSYYLIGDRSLPTIESTRFDQWASNKTSWKLTTRVAGMPWLDSYFTYEDGSTQVSPFITLAA